MPENSIDLSELSGYDLEDALRDRFPWANDRAIEDSLLDAAILINSIMMAMDSNAEDAALLVMAGQQLENQQNIADAVCESLKRERKIFATLTREYAEKTTENFCCLVSLSRLAKAVEARNEPA